MREHSAGGVVIRRVRGQLVFAAIRPQGRPEGHWVLPKGLVEPGEQSLRRPPCARCTRRPACAPSPCTRLPSSRYIYRRGSERVFKVVEWWLMRALGGRDRRDRGGDARRGRRCALAAARGCRGACSPTAASGRSFARRASSSIQPTRRRGSIRPWNAPGAGDPLYALNFYSPLVADQLRHRRKTVTIRLGDKSSKYRKGIIVRVLDRAALRPARPHLRRRHRQGRGQAARRGVAARGPARQPRGAARSTSSSSFLGQLYNREVDDDDTVTVIHFSEIRAARAPARSRCRRCRATSPPRRRTRARGRRGARPCGGSAGRRTRPRGRRARTGR